MFGNRTPGINFSHFEHAVCQTFLHILGAKVWQKSAEIFFSTFSLEKAAKFLAFKNCAQLPINKKLTPGH